MTLDVPGVRRDAAALAAKLLPVITSALKGDLRVVNCTEEGVAREIPAQQHLLFTSFVQAASERYISIHPFVQTLWAASSATAWPAWHQP